MSLVYFIKPIGMDGPIKIGHSERPAKRLVELGAWSPWPLELIGSVPGIYADEQFLHQCFATTHSHREWFHSSPALRAAIVAIVASGSIAVARETLIPKGKIRPTVASRWSEDRRRSASYSSRIRFAVKKLRKALGEDGLWYEPADVSQIMTRWRSHKPPLEVEIARLDEYLKDPGAHSIEFPWKKKAAA